MAGLRPGSIGICSLAAAFCLGAGAMLGTPTPVHAQGLFDLLGSIFRGTAPRAYRAEPPRLLEGFPGDEHEEAPASGPGGPYVSYCVRLCDGRYFPLPRNAGGPSTSPAQLCSAMCPATKTKIFSGTQIERAVDAEGKRYSAIKNALLYRERLVPDCTCNGSDTAGIAAIDVAEDPTLRPGDIVVTAQGPKVFQGDGRTPHRTSEFVPVEQARGVPKRMREELSQMRIAPERLTATAKSGEPATDRTVGAVAKPALTMMPDGGEAQEGERAARQN